ncbi:galactinol synthase [Musa troglodytarum]|uniref:Hexosyltransferase n=1 Tax=Musa troglodytarum TaxID=320322 RepID=A0A9E7KZP4_9LILI|nr:galactinol synthase [Musa troglodytarum]
MASENLEGPFPSTPLRHQVKKRAYVTFLAGDGDYVKGVVGLVKGLRKVKTGYPLVVAVLPDVPELHRQLLQAQGCIVREIEPVHPPENQVQFAMAYYVINYSKLRIWNGSKPWRFTGNEANMNREDIKMLVAKWWDIYNDDSLDFKEEDAVPEGDTCLRPASIMVTMSEQRNQLHTCTLCCPGQNQ